MSQVSDIVVFFRHGGPEVLEVMQLEKPELLRTGEVWVRVMAAGVQPFDANFRAGRIDWKTAKFPQQLGNEIAGVVHDVGSDVTWATVGDEVLGWVPFRGYAEHAVAKADHLVRKPADMPWEVAGVLSASGQTAATACRDLGVGPADTLLVHAAAGGVGSFAVQIAVAAGATVVGTASEANHEYVASLGAIPVSYGPGLADRVRHATPDGVTAALDAVGTDEALHVSMELVADPNRVGSLVNDELAERLGARVLGTRRSVAQLTELVELYERGQLRVEIQQRYPLKDAHLAHRDIESGHVRGKIVLTP